ncbi:unnamed protein product [Microthlaspi erraticum]|uniref:Uncharacterized protein n=1 Tax=Microthlaspi erraticum TaxID=1685480 RepID=A0A6D2KEJ3_9BRAS|nr:unnamed protein product [Microthlaspi erraticum]
METQRICGEDERSPKLWLHYVENDRIPPIIGLVDEGFKVEQKKSEAKECGGAHGYDNAFFSMRTIFIGHGPMFLEGKKVASFENVEIYNVISLILGLKAAPNNAFRYPQNVRTDCLEKITNSAVY